MLKYTLLAAASLGCAAFTIGCQNSGHSTAEADYNERPHMASTYTRTDTSTAAPAGYSATADLSAYNTPYTLKRDSSYMMSPTSTTTAGTLRSGDTVYVRSGTDLATSANNGWVAAKTADGRLVYVRADDLQMK
jgi:hypothetical protein